MDIKKEDPEAFINYFGSEGSAGIFITRKKIRRILQAVHDDFCILQENHGIKNKKSYISY